MITDEYKEIMQRAIAARERSYSPYSGFAVGAALLCEDGVIYEGCNIENGAFSPTVCAERVAFFKALSDGKRGFAAIAVAGGKSGGAPKESCPPCGVCRQVMTEFCGGDFAVILGTSPEDCIVYRLEEILPLAFKKE